MTPTAQLTGGTGEQSTVRAGAAAKAVAFMQAFARPAVDVSATAWWANVRSHLSVSAAADYEGTDPANVPFTTVTGPPVTVPVEAPEELVVAVRVPTDGGDYLVEVATTPTGQWVTRATPTSTRQ